MNNDRRALAAHTGESPGKRRAAVIAVLAMIFAMLTTINVIGSPQAAQAAAVCTPGNIYANTGGAVNELNKYSTTGDLVSSVPLARSYTDIAFLGDGVTLYGIAPGTPTVLYTINPDTGAEIASVPVTGLPATAYFANALSALPDGSLLVGAAPNGETGRMIFEINPTTGVATPFQAMFPTGFGSAGDFLSLADGDILAVGSTGSGGSLFRIAPDFSVTEVGTVPQSFGAAQSGGNIYLAGSNGDVYEIASVPVVPSTSPVPLTTIAATGLPFFGATSPQDSGLCSELTLVKSVDPADAATYEVGQELTYSFVVTNTGNTTLTNISVTEGAFTGSGQLGPITPASVPSLAPGAVTTFTATYTLTQADVDRGTTSNTATATGVPPTGPPIESPPSTVEVPSIPAPGLSLVKSADRNSVSAAGQTLTYSFLVTNTGNRTLTDVTVEEGAFTGSGALGAITPASVATLAPGASTTFTATYTLTQADIDRGTTSNTATATGVPPTGPPIESPPSTVEIPSIPAPGLSLVKSVTPSDEASYEVGQELTYSFLVTNTGNTTLTDVTVEEGAFTGSGTLGAITPASVATLAPGASTTFTATYTLTQADIDRGTTSNTATATGVPPTGPPIESPPSTVEIPSIPAPGLSLVKSVTPSDEASYEVGQELTYSFLVTNTGNTTLTDVTVEEGAFTGSGTLGAITPASVATLAPGASTTFTATYTLTQADIDRGTTSNTATATGVPPTGPPIESPPSTVEIPSIPAPGLSLVKSVDRPSVSTVGQTITYSFLVTNTGNTTLTGVTVKEGAFTGSGQLGPITPASVATLAPGASTTFTATYVVTRADLQSGSLSNTATATGVPPTGPPIESPPSTVKVPAAPPFPGLATTGSEPLWAALLAAAFLLVLGGALKVRSGSRFSRS
ncbi:hypothetical protein F6W70_10585 [Microbacterium maritypicum]|uniref:DUF7507 domain-containing protein n=3 Tax=Microbacterium maritypicum TaxID=33918 RepID=A0AAD3X667_MICMQ|nr:DUF11 domain-containing protein [Microbacterium liquefaciens]KAB1887788.1 hypothetical protein F6W70_10585 [Microbacterium liquefaciens]